MRRLFAFLAVGALVAVVTASAAALNVTNDVVLQAGGDDILTCDEDGVTVHPVTELDGFPNVVTGIRVSGIDAACVGNDLFVIVTQDGAHLADGGPVTITGGSHSVPLDSPQDAVVITDVHVVIETA